MGLTFNCYSEKCNKSITLLLGYRGVHTGADAEIKNANSVQTPACVC